MPQHRHLAALVPSLACCLGFAAEEAAPPATADDRIEVAAEGDQGFAGAPPAALKLDLPLRRVPQSVTVLDDELLEATGAFSLREALRSAPGVTMAAGENGRTGDSLAIRGFVANTDIYVDGLKDSAQYFRDTFNLAQVEVVKGPSSALVGRGATGGAVNLVTRRPTARWEGEAAVTGGSDRLLRLEAGAGGPAMGDLGGVRVDAYLHDADSFRDEQHQRRWGVAPTVVATPGTDTAITLQVMHQDSDGTMDYGVPYLYGAPAEVPVETYYGFADDSFAEYGTTLYTATIEHRAGALVSLRNATRYSDNTRHYRTEALGAVDYATLEVARSQILARNVYHGLINQSEVRLGGEEAGRRWSVLVGLELAHEQYDFRSRASTGVPSVAVFDPRSPTTVGAGRADSLEDPTTRNQALAQTAAGYVHALWEVAEGLTLVGGGRYDRYAADYRTGTATVTRLSRTDRMPSWRGGAVWEPVSALSVYASAGTAFNPSAETFSLNAATADLDPEHTVAYEVGARTALFEEALLLSAAVFRIDKDQARTVDPTDTTVQTLDGRQRVDGIELGAVGSPAAIWQVFGGLTLMRGEVLRSNNTATTWDGVVVPVEGLTPVNLPTASGSLWTTVEVGAGFTIGAGLYASSAFYTDQANSRHLPGYLRADAMAGWAGDGFGARWRAQLNLVNLFDTVYYESGSTNSAYPGAPLGGQLTLGARY